MGPTLCTQVCTFCPLCHKILNASHSFYFTVYKDYFFYYFPSNWLLPLDYGHEEYVTLRKKQQKVWKVDKQAKKLFLHYLYYRPQSVYGIKTYCIYPISIDNITLHEKF